MLARRLLPIGAALGLAGAIWQVRAANVRAERELASLRAEVAGLRATGALGALGGRRPTLARVVSADHVSDEPNDAADERREAAAQDLEDRAPAAPRSHAEAVAQLGERFTGETIDGGWAAPTTATLQQALTAILPAGGNVRALSCRSTLCRLELSLPDAEKLDAFQREALYGEHILWRGPATLTPTPQSDGSVALTAYLVRDEAAL